MAMGYNDYLTKEEIDLIAEYQANSRQQNQQLSDERIAEKIQEDHLGGLMSYLVQTKNVSLSNAKRIIKQYGERLQYFPRVISKIIDSIQDFLYGPI